MSVSRKYLLRETANVSAGIATYEAPRTGDFTGGYSDVPLDRKKKRRFTSQKLQQIFDKVISQSEDTREAEESNKKHGFELLRDNQKQNDKRKI